MDVSLPVLNAPADKIVHDPAHAVAAEVGVEYPAHQFRLRPDDLQAPAALEAVAVGRLGGDELAQLHSSPEALASVFGDGNGFLLGQSAENAHQEFRGERFRVNIFFFELDGNAEGHQLPQSGEAVFRVPGEAGEGLHQHLVDPALPAVGEHTVEVLPLVCFRAADRFVSQCQARTNKKL